MDVEGTAPPSRPTLAFLNQMAALQEGVSLTREGAAMNKSSRRQPASTSLYSCEKSPVTGSSLLFTMVAWKMDGSSAAAADTGMSDTQHKQHPKSKGDKELEASVKVSTIKNVVQDIISVLKEQLEILRDEEYKSDRKLRLVASSVDVSVGALETLLQETDRILKLRGALHFGTRYSSIIRADDHYEAKKKSLLGEVLASDAKSEPLRRLKAKLKADRQKRSRKQSTKRSSERSQAKKTRHSLQALEQMGIYLPLPEGDQYMCAELTKLLVEREEGTGSTTLDYKTIWSTLFDRKLYIATYPTFMRHLKEYRDTGVLPRASSDGIRCGRPPIIKIDRVNKSLLEAFVKVRSLQDATEKMKMPNKGDSKKVEDGLHCPRTGEVFLVQMAFDLRNQPVKATVPAHSGEEPIAPITANPTVVSSHFARSQEVEKFAITGHWVRQAYSAIRSLQLQDNLESQVDVRLLDIHTMQAQTLAKLLVERLPAFVATRIPSRRGDLLVGQHWNWRSFTRHIPRIAALMCLSGHILSTEQLQRRKRHEGYLGPTNNFKKATGEVGLLDGNYVVMDTDRSSIIRSGKAEAGFVSRWEGHQQAAKLNTRESLKSTFYLSYPDENATSRSSDRLGTFQQLDQLCGIGFTRSMKQQVANLFEWDEVEVNKLQSLSSDRNGILDRKYRHIAYLCEAAYAVAIKPDENLSGNPTCEWQLRYYGNNDE